MTRQQTVRRARALRRNIKWIKETFFQGPPSTPQEEQFHGLLCDFDRVLVEILRAARRGDWPRADVLVRAFSEATGISSTMWLNPHRRDYAEEN